MSRVWNKWSESEVESLKKLWPSSSREELMKSFPGRSYSQLKDKARHSEIRSEGLPRKRYTRMEYLLNYNDPEVAYWWGFIMADGCINDQQIIISIHENDKDHLIKLAERLNAKVKYVTRINDWHTTEYTMIRIACSGKHIINKINTVFKFNGPKTYNPPKLDVFFNRELLYAFFTGYVDGDGNINFEKKNHSIRIKVHGNWFNTLQLISDNLYKFYDIKCQVSLNKKGNAILNISRKEFLLKLKSLNKHLPYLKRKWDKIN